MGLATGVTVRGMRGNYRVESVIASGGLGRVWKARADNGAFVAIKEPLTAGPPDQVRINFEKLKVEATVLEKLTGPRQVHLSDQSQAYDLDPTIRTHIVRFVDVDNDTIRPNGQIIPSVLVMEYVNGTSFDDFRGVKRLNPSRIEDYWVQVLNVVKALHENNILHRDISPHNLISTPEPERDPVLIDFGTVKEGFNQLSANPDQWSQIVKAGFSAPELANGRPPASPSSDLYSVAATFLFMYTGQNPQYLQTTTGEFDPALRSVLQRIPNGRLTLIRKAMNINPADRYQTVDDVLDALGGKIAYPFAGPYIVANGRKFEIKGNMVIGKAHTQCADECRRKGFSNAPDIPLNDPQRYVSRHHARIRLTSNGECFIEDLHAVSGTAIKHPTSSGFEKLQPRREYPLRDGDLIALAYSPIKGPYMTIPYREK